MAVFPLTDCSVVINSVDLSEYCVSVDVANTRELVDITAMGDTARKSIGSLGNNSCTFTFNQDFAATKVYATLASLVGVPTTIVVKPTSSAVGATNPSFTYAEATLESNPLLSGSVGDLAQVSVTFTGGTFTAATS